MTLAPGFGLYLAISTKSFKVKSESCAVKCVSWAQKVDVQLYWDRSSAKRAGVTPPTSTFSASELGMSAIILLHGLVHCRLWQEKCNGGKKKQPKCGHLTYIAYIVYNCYRAVWLFVAISKCRRKSFFHRGQDKGLKILFVSYVPHCSGSQPCPLLSLLRLRRGYSEDIFRHG